MSTAWDLLSNVTEEALPSEGGSVKSAAVFVEHGKLDTSMSRLASFLSLSGMKLLNGISRAQCRDFDLVVLCFSSESVLVNWKQGIEVVSNCSNTVCLVNGPVSLDYLPIISARMNGQGLVDQFRHACLDTMSAKKNLSTQNIVTAMGAAVETRKIEGVSNIRWLASAGGPTTWICKAKSQSIQDGKRVGSVLKKVIQHSKLKFFREFSGVFINMKRHSSTVVNVVKKYDPEIKIAHLSFTVNCKSASDADALLEEVVNEKSVLEAAHCFQFQVVSPYRSVILCESLLELNAYHPSYDVAICDVDVKCDTIFETPRKDDVPEAQPEQSPAPPQQRPVAAVAPPIASSIEAQSSSSAVRNDPAPATALMEKTLQELVKENQELKKELLEERSLRERDVSRLEEAINEIRAKAADHELVEQAISSLRDSSPSESQLDDLAERIIARAKQEIMPAVNAVEMNARSDSRVVELRHIVNDQFNTFKRFQQGTGIAIDKLHAQLLHLDKVSNSTTQSLSHQLQQLQHNMQALSASIQRTQDQSKNQQSENSSSAETRQYCNNAIQQMSVAVREQLMALETKLSHSTPVHAPHSDHSGEIDILNQKVGRMRTETVDLDNRVHELELLKAQVSSLLETSTEQAEKFHSLDDKLDDLFIKVESLSQH